MILDSYPLQKQNLKLRILNLYEMFHDSPHKHIMRKIDHNRVKRNFSASLIFSYQGILLTYTEARRYSRIVP